MTDLGCVTDVRVVPPEDWTDDERATVECSPDGTRVVEARFSGGDVRRFVELPDDQGPQ